MLLRRYFALLAVAALLLATTAGCESMHELNRWDGPTDHGQFSVLDPIEDEDAEQNDRDESKTTKCICGR